MDTKKFIDSLFNEYDETIPLLEFKEELKSNIDEHIKTLMSKGIDKETAFKKATEELGDISEVAKEISLKKKQEVYEEMYMGIRNYLTPKRILLYVLILSIIPFSIIGAIREFIKEGFYEVFLMYLLLFAPLELSLLTFAFLTQETSSKYPMSKKRASAYAICVFFIICTISTTAIAYIGLNLTEMLANELGMSYYEIPHGMSNQDLTILVFLSLSMIFALPSIFSLICLKLPEKDRRKPWAIKSKLSKNTIE